MERINGKITIITGGARGIGAAIASLFVTEGAKVVIADVLEEEGTALAKHLGKSALFHRLDVSDEASWRLCLETTTRHFGDVDVLVNNAGILHAGDYLEFLPGAPAL